MVRFCAVPRYPVDDLVSANRIGNERDLVDCAARRAGNIAVTYVDGADMGVMDAISHPVR